MRFQDVEHLSTYLDGRLSAAESSRLEARLVGDADLRRALNDLRLAKHLLGRTPRRRAPRNFTLNPMNLRVRGPRPAVVPPLRYAGALASVLFFFTVAVNTISPLAARNLAAAPAVPYGVGGGYGGEAPQVEAPAESMAMQAGEAPAAEATPPAADLAGAPAAEPLEKGQPSTSDSAAETAAPVRAPVPWSWALALAVAGVCLAGLSWYLDGRSRRDFRSKFLEK